MKELTVTKDQRNKILIIDDEQDIARILNLHLSEAGYQTDWAADGETGLTQLTSSGFSLVLLDIRMPGISGVEVLHRLKAENIDTAVIMMSAHGNENLVAECMKAGAADYVSKPFDADDLLHRIDRALTIRRTLKEKLLLEQEKEDFIAMLSHDLKNPITAVIGSIDIMRSGCLGTINPEQEEYLQSAIDSCNEVVTMIDNLLDIKKFEAGKIQMSIRPYMAKDLIEKIVRQYSRAAKFDGIELSADLAAADSEIEVDKNAFTRILGNLIGNALKFTPEGGSITISCRRLPHVELSELEIPAYAAIPPDFTARGDITRISVRDTGVGISTDELNRIFDRFTQLSRRTERERGGAGLGLAFCKKAVEIFNGCIWAESRESEGSEFVILLPCHDNNETCDITTSEKQI